MYFPIPTNANTNANTNTNKKETINSTIIPICTNVNRLESEHSLFYQACKEKSIALFEQCEQTDIPMENTMKYEIYIHLALLHSEYDLKKKIFHESH